MQKQLLSLALVIGAGLVLAPAAISQKIRVLPTKLFTAKSVYFDNQTGFPAVGDDAVRELQKWGRFEVVRNRNQAELLFVLSSKEEGDLSNVPDPRFGPDLSIHFRYRPANAYLTVIDLVTGERLWSSSHVWGGLLTGFNSAGRRLVHRLRNQVER